MVKIILLIVGITLSRSYFFILRILAKIIVYILYVFKVLMYFLTLNAYGFFTKNIIKNTHFKVIGFLLSLSALSGSVASLVVGYCVDRSKKFKETIKFLYLGIALVAVAINVVD